MVATARIKLRLQTFRHFIFLFHLLSSLILLATRGPENIKLSLTCTNAGINLMWSHLMSPTLCESSEASTSFVGRYVNECVQYTDMMANGSTSANTDDDSRELERF